MQLTVEEQRQINKWVGHEKKSGSAVVKILNKQRLARKQPQVEKSSVYRLIRGDTHSQDLPEARGRHKTLTRADIRKLQQARRRLLRAASCDLAGYCGRGCLGLCPVLACGARRTAWHWRPLPNSSS